MLYHIICPFCEYKLGKYGDGNRILDCPRCRAKLSVEINGDNITIEKTDEKETNAKKVKQ